MISENDARAIVQTAIEGKNATRPDDDPLIVREDKTIERELLFAFFFNLKRYFESGQLRYMLAGNGPVIVNRRTGELVFCGTNKKPSAFIEEYERRISEGTW